MRLNGDEIESNLRSLVMAEEMGGHCVVIDPDKIRAVAAVNGVTRVYFARGRFVRVKQSVDEMLGKMKACRCLTPAVDESNLIHF